MDDHCEEHSAHARAISSFDKRLDAHGSQLDALNETLAALKEIERQNQQRIDDIDMRVTAVEQKPGKRWDELVSRALLVAMAAIAGYALNYIGF